MNITLVVKMALGLERVCADEIRLLTRAELEIRNGEVLVAGDEELMIQFNLQLRAAERVNIRLHESPCADFDELFDAVVALPWGELLPQDAKIIVTGSTRNSELKSVRTMQSMVKKAIVTVMQRTYGVEKLPESGPAFEIEFAIDGEKLAIDLNTSGDGLHRRGYRTETGEAPLRETLAASLVLLSGWDGTRALIDPFTGSGTIPIEAALLARNIAPGLSRTFAAESWPWLDKALWRDARTQARAAQSSDPSAMIFGSDKDSQVLTIAKRNAERANVSDVIRFERCIFEQLRIELPEATVVANPPYGERIGDERELRTLYRAIKLLIEQRPSWKFHLYSGDPDFESRVSLQPTKRRKLYNSTIKAYLYSYN